MAKISDQDPAVATAEGTAWRRRVVTRSTETAKLRAEQRIQRFLDAAHALMEENGTTDFTVQQVVERSRQSLRSFYQYFDGKHELLLALFEEALNRAAIELRRVADDKQDPMARLEAVVRRLFELAKPDQHDSARPLSDFALQLLAEHPFEVAAAHAALYNLFVELMDQAAADELLRPADPRGMASLVLQLVMFAAHNHQVPAGAGYEPVTGDEVWEFCLYGISPGESVARRTRAAVRSDRTLLKVED
jgi:AcrR family transcriptional regulator